ncbi:MAG: flagellar biosynthesis protein FlhF [Gammaproteobacteria bacterium]|jgi:flagellar biosynthesis protein FlhF
MKIKRFFSQDMRSAIRLVREELGADAVILSNDRVNGGVEIVAAVDYDEAILEPSAASTERHFSQAEPNSNSHSNKAVGAEQARRNNPHATVNSNARNSQRNNQRAAENDRGSNNTARQAPAQSASRVNQHPSRTESHKTQRAADYASTAKQSGFEDFSDELLNDEEFLDADEYLADIGTGDTGTGNIEAGEIGEYGNQHLNSSLHNRIESAFKPAAKKESPYLRNQNDHQTNASAEFYTLDEALPEEVKVNDTLYDTEQAQKFPHELVNGKNADGDGSYSVWSQEPTLVAMRNEITNLRGMLEQQLTGLAWNDLKKNNPLRAKLIKQLLELGFGPELANQVIQSSEGQSDDYRKAWQMTLSSLAEKLPIQDDDVALSGGVVALVGATGVGKTTTIAKLAARYALRHGRNSIVLITTDTYRIGALEQLRTYGRILGIPVKIAHNKKQLQDLLKMLSEKKLVLIDTAGMGQRDIRLMEQFSVINDCAMGLKTLLVLSSTTHRAALDETVRSFSNVEINGCILTKLDETTNLGAALSVVTEHQLRVAYISDGQRVPEDLHLARAHTLINRCVSIARRANQPLDNDSLELAYSRMPSHVSA